MKIAIPEWSIYETTFKESDIFKPNPKHFWIRHGDFVESIVQNIGVFDGCLGVDEIVLLNIFLNKIHKFAVKGEKVIDGGVIDGIADGAVHKPSVLELAFWINLFLNNWVWECELFEGWVLVMGFSIGRILIVLTYHFKVLDEETLTLGDSYH